MGLEIILDEGGYNANKLIGWLPKRDFIKGDFAVTLPNGLEKEVKNGWRLTSNDIGQFFRDYSALEITDTCTVTCAGLCSTYAKKSKENAKECSIDEFVQLDFIKDLARIIASEPYRDISNNYNSGSYGSGNFGLFFERFSKTHVSSPSHNGERTFCITGGEPTKHPKYKEIINKFLKIKNLRIVFATNLTRCAEDGFFEFFKEAAKSNPHFELQFSYNSSLQEEYKKIVNGNKGYEFLRKSIPKQALKGRPEDALLSTIEYALSEAPKNGLTAIVRITQSPNDKYPFLQNHFKDYMTRNGHDNFIELNYEPKVLKDSVNYYVANIVGVGYAKNNQRVSGPSDFSSPYEIYIDGSGGVKPHSYYGNPIGWIGTLK